MHFETRSLGKPWLSQNCVDQAGTQRDLPASTYCVLGLKMNTPLEAPSGLSVHEVRNQAPQASVLGPLPCLGTHPPKSTLDSSQWSLAAGQVFWGCTGPRGLRRVLDKLATRPILPRPPGPEQCATQPVSSRLSLEGLTRHLGTAGI